MRRNNYLEERLYLLMDGFAARFNHHTDVKGKELLEACFGDNYIEEARQIVKESIYRLLKYGTVTLDDIYMHDKVESTCYFTMYSDVFEVIKGLVIKELEYTSEFHLLKGIDSVYYYENLGESCQLALNLDTIKRSVDCMVNFIMGTEVTYDELADMFKFYDIMCFEAEKHRGIKSSGEIDKNKKIMYEAFGVVKGYMHSSDEKVLIKVKQIEAFLNSGGHRRYLEAFRYINKISDNLRLCDDIIIGHDVSIEDLMEDIRYYLTEEEMRHIKCIEF